MVVNATLRTFWILLASLVAIPAHAHLNSDLVTSFIGGLSHPLSGWDHWMAMLWVGIWASTLARRAWMAPAGFILGLGLGAFVGQHLGTFGPWSVWEALVSISLLGLGLLLWGGFFASRMSQVLGLCAMLGFGLCHGWVHGQELPLIQGQAPLFGVILCSALLHAWGWWVGQRFLQVMPRIRRVLAVLAMGAGSGLLAGLA